MERTCRLVGKRPNALHKSAYWSQISLLSKFTLTYAWHSFPKNKLILILKDGNKQNV